MGTCRKGAMKAFVRRPRSRQSAFRTLAVPEAERRRNERFRFRNRVLSCPSLALTGVARRRANVPSALPVHDAVESPWLAGVLNPSIASGR
jgi:hypothetical protein